MTDTKVKSDFLNTLQARGFIHQCTDIQALDDYLLKGPAVCYIGFDATADSLHVGSLLPIMMLRHFQKSGHKPIVLMGGGTTKIGDPSGKDESRKMITADFIEQNIKGISRVFNKYLSFGDDKSDAIMLNNEDWLKHLNYIDLLQEIGRHFTINRMLTFDSVKLRLDREQPLTFLEFNYMILQAYDFMELAKLHDCRLEMGGADQWGNIINGIDLTRRMLQKEVYGLTSPLLTTASGAKMGKSANGAIWLNADKCSPYDFWQYWRNTEDADVVKFLKLFTELPLSQIEDLAKLEGNKINEAKIILANEVTTLCHGDEEAKKAHDTATQTFAAGGIGASENLPSHNISKAEIDKGYLLMDAYLSLELTKTKGETRRLMDGGGAKINDQPIKDYDYKITESDFQDQDFVKISAGKKKHGLVKIN